MAEETSPLLPGREKKTIFRNVPIVWRIEFCAFVISLSIAFTWVPMIYVFRLMTCDEYYRDHSPFNGHGDRCSVNEIEASTAKAVSLLGTTTTCFGVLNLFITNWLIKKYGVKTALVHQTIWPALRLICQIWGVSVGAAYGMRIIQFSQIFCIMGGNAGYLLATNTYAGEVVKPSERTTVFGQLQGYVMFGTGFGYFFGGLVCDLLGPRRPYEIAFALMVISSVYSICCLPKVVMQERTDEPSGSRSLARALSEGIAAFVTPAKLFEPQKYRLSNGHIKLHYGVLFLGLGVFFGVLATGFIPILIQMYATNAFNFHATENGYVMSFNSLIRGCFLSFGFPKIISYGRRWYAAGNMPTFQDNDTEIPTAPEDFEPVPALRSEEEPTKLKIVNEAAGSAFDLAFLKWSLVADGLLTGSAAFSREGWHIYLAAFLLPLASGSAPAAKGVMVEMCDPSKRTDALSAISLVEMIATLSTISIFGLVFAAFAEIGKPHLVFFCNAAVAALAVFILAFSHFPAAGSKRTEDEQSETEDVVHSFN